MLGPQPGKVEGNLFANNSVAANHCVQEKDPTLQLYRRWVTSKAHPKGEETHEHEYFNTDIRKLIEK